MAGKVSAAAHAGHQAPPAGPAIDEAECPRPEMITGLPAPASPLDAVDAVDPAGPARWPDRNPVLPRRRRVSALPDTLRDRAGLPSPADDGLGPISFTARPDLDVLAQVLRGLQRMV